MAPKKKAEKKEETVAVEEKKDVEMTNGAEKKKDEEPAKSTEPEGKPEAKDEKKKEDEPTEEAKKEEKEENAVEEEAKEPEKPKELEEDAPSDTRAKVKPASLAWSSSDCTLNVQSVAGGKVFSSLTEGGMQFLLSSIRANFGLKAGRYMFETRIIERMVPSDKGGRGDQSASKPPEPKNVFRVGLSLAGSSQFLGDTQDSICFDSDGHFVFGKKKQKLMKEGSFGKGTLAVLVNLDENSPNAFTVSLFKNGARVCKPQPIPDKLKGKPLFPTITYRNYTFETNFGATALKPLPFTCRMVDDAASADVDVVAETTPKDGKYEVLFPVALPDTGMFDWIDDFLAKNPGYTELSDRKLIEWAAKSGMWKPKNKDCNDKPTMHFGIPLIDDRSVKSVLQAVVPTLNRNFVIAELKENLVKKSREASLGNWSRPNFKTTAAVLMGEPSKEYKDLVHALILKEKTAKAEAERKQKVTELQRKKSQEERKKKSEEAKKKKEEIKKNEKQEGEAKEEEEKKDDAKEAEEVKEEVPATSVEDEVPPVAVELTEEELKTIVRKLDLKDISEKTLSKFYTSFALPDSDEGFNEVRYVWQDASACAEIMKKYMLEQKLTQKAEDLQPSAWFKEQLTTWKKTYEEWRKKQSEWKDPVKRKALLQKKLDASKEKGEEDPKPPAEVDVDSLDVSSVEDVADVGSGEPLFAKFAFEDWILLSVRYKLHLLMHAFRKDLDDPERASFPESHLSFYYNKYFRESFSIENYGFKIFADFVEIIKEVIQVGEKSSLLEPQLAEDTPLANFVKLTEEHRRDRVRRVDAGDETANLKFKRQAPESRGESRDKGGGKSSGKGGSSKASRKGSGKDASRPTTPSREKGGGSAARPAPRRDYPPATRPRTTYEDKPSSGGYGNNGGYKREWSSTRSEEPAWKRPRTDDGYSGGKGYGKSNGKGHGKSKGKSGGYRR